MKKRKRFFKLLEHLEYNPGDPIYLCINEYSNTWFIIGDDDLVHYSNNDDYHIEMFDDREELFDFIKYDLERSIKYKPNITWDNYSKPDVSWDKYRYYVCYNDYTDEYTVDSVRDVKYKLGGNDVSQRYFLGEYDILYGTDDINDAADYIRNIIGNK